MDPERAPQGDVRPHVRRDDAGWSLGREDQVHSERPSYGGEPDEPADEVRQLLREDLELINDEYQAGERVAVRASEAPVVVEVFGPDGGKEALTALHLGTEGRQGPGRQVLVEIGHDAEDMGQVGAVPEG